MRTEPQTWTPWQRRAWSVINASTAPLWLLMILLPGRAVTKAALAAATPLQVGLGLTYAGFLGRSAVVGKEKVNFFDGASVARGLSTPEGALTGWAHFISFDLFVGMWIHRTAMEEGLNPRLALLLTWWAGPTGLTLFTWQRRSGTQ